MNIINMNIIEAGRARDCVTSELPLPAVIMVRYTEEDGLVVDVVPDLSHHRQSARQKSRAKAAVRAVRLLQPGVLQHLLQLQVR